MKFNDLRRATKNLMFQKKKDFSQKLSDTVLDNPKRFWSLVKSSTTLKSRPNFLRDKQKIVTDRTSRANMMNSFFHSVFTPKNNKHIDLQDSYSGQPLSDIVLSVSDVQEVLTNLDPNKACGPDNIPGRLLKITAAAISPSLCRLFNMSLSQGSVPAIWKKANITPIHKGDDPSLPANYRPISLLCILSKVLERCVFNRCFPHISPSLYHLQYGFRPGRSTESQLLVVYHDLLDSMASGKEIDAIYLDLSKAFDKVPHHLLISKLSSFGISGCLLKWYQSYLCDRYQRVALEGAYSDWLPVTSGVPQGSILGPLLFLVFANDLPDYVQSGSTLALFADDSKLYRSLDTPDSNIYLQQDLDGLRKWSSDNHMTFNASKCKTLHISRKKTLSCVQTYDLGGQHLECVKHTKDLGITVSCDLQWGKHIELITSKANRTLGLIKRVCRDVDDVKIRKLLYCLMVRPQLEYCSCLWSPYTIKHRALIENVQRRATKFILNYPPRDISYMDRLISLNLLPLEYRRELRDILLFHKFTSGTMPTNCSNLFSPATSVYATRNFDQNNFKIKVDHKQNYFRYSFFSRVVKVWNNLPKNFKNCKYKTLKKLLLDHYVSILPSYSPP